jgi:hypothetical protein
MIKPFKRIEISHEEKDRKEKKKNYLVQVDKFLHKR